MKPAIPPEELAATNEMGQRMNQVMTNRQAERHTKRLQQMVKESNRKLTQRRRDAEAAIELKRELEG
mgnify:CR=1 FL=1